MSQYVNFTIAIYKNQQGAEEYVDADSGYGDHAGESRSAHHCDGVFYRQEEIEVGEWRVSAGAVVR